MGNAIGLNKKDCKKDWVKIPITHTGQHYTSTGDRAYARSSSPINRQSLNNKESKERFKQFKKKVKRDKKRNILKEMNEIGIRNMTVENTIKPIRKAITKLLTQVFPDSMQMSMEYITLKKEVISLDDR